MALRSNKVREDKTKEITIKPEFYGEPVEIRYRQIARTVREEKEFKKQLDDATTVEQIDILAGLVCQLVTFIDWQDEQGQQVPLTVERLMDEPVEVLMFILNSVTDDISAKQKK